MVRIVGNGRERYGWSGRQVLVIGAARQGLALARYLARHGAQVTLNDRRPAEALQTEQESLADLPVEWALGGHPLELLDGKDLVCVSGGVPLTLPIVQAAQEDGIPLSNDSQIFMEAVPCRVIGITGSAGKTTTTSLVGLIAQESAALQNAGRGPSNLNMHVWIGGNIGVPLIGMLDDMQPQDVAVMELSSFQLELMERSPQIAAVLNVTPNHLDRHGTMQAYTAAKRRILEGQSSEDAAILGRDDPGAWALADRVAGRLLSFGLSDLPAGHEGTFVREDAIYLRLAEGEFRIMPLSAIQLRGRHNLQNVLAACAIAAAADMPAEAMQAGVESFRGVRHRLEFVRSWGGADWYDDSIATSPERSMAAMRAFDEPLVLLAGGRDKDLPWADFAELVVRRVDHVILFGEAAELIQHAIDEAAKNISGELPTRSICKNLREAVQAASDLASPGDVVLLSPGGTSFDEFTDFEERGECFAQLVRDLP